MDKDDKDLTSEDTTAPLDTDTPLNNGEDQPIPEEELASDLNDDENYKDNLSKENSGLSHIISNSDVYYERLPMLEVVFDRLVRLSTSSFRNFTGDNVEISLEYISSIRFGDYIASIPNPTMLNVFTVEEWDNNGIVTIDNDLIYTMIDVLLGGRTGNALMRYNNRYFTTIELNIIEKLVTIFLNDLSAAFDPLCPVTLRLDRLETNPKFATISHPTNISILVRLSVKMEERGGSMELLIPTATLEPIREMLLQNYMGEKFGRDSIWESHLVKQLVNTDFELSAVLDEITLDLADVLNWEVGSQIHLNATPNTPVKLVCESQPLFYGNMGRKSGNIAIKVDKIIRPLEE